MIRFLIIWLIPAALYGAFIWHFTNWDGPLTPLEVEFFQERLTEQNVLPERRTQLRAFMEADDGGDFLMVNLLDARRLASQPKIAPREAMPPPAVQMEAPAAETTPASEAAEGDDVGAFISMMQQMQANPSGIGDTPPAPAVVEVPPVEEETPADTATEFVPQEPAMTDAEVREMAEAAMDNYLAFMAPELLMRGSHPILVGDALSAAMEMFGLEGAKNWTSVGIVRYRSRRDMMEIITLPEFTQKHPLKTDALAKTVAVPIDSTFNVDARPALGFFLFFVCAILWFLTSFRRRRGEGGDEAAGDSSEEEAF